MAVFELTRDGSFFKVETFETKEQAEQFIKEFEKQYENQGSYLVLDD